MHTNGTCINGSAQKHDWPDCCRHGHADLTREWGASSPKHRAWRAWPSFACRAPVLLQSSVLLRSWALLQSKPLQRGPVMLKQSSHAWGSLWQRLRLGVAAVEVWQRLRRGRTLESVFLPSSSKNCLPRQVCHASPKLRLKTSRCGTKKTLFAFTFLGLRLPGVQRKRHAI